MAGNDKLKQKLQEIKEDCLKLKEQGQLTEYSRGQLDLIEIINEYLTEKI